MRSKYRSIDVVPVLDTAVLATGDVIANATETGKIGEPGKVLLWDSIQVLDSDDQAQNFDVVLSRATLTMGTLNAAISISDADAAKIVGFKSVSTKTDLVNSNLYREGALGQLIELSPSGTLFVSVICRGGTPTYTAAGMKMKLGFR